MELGEFLYPQGYARYRYVPFSAQQSLVMISVLDGVSGNMLEEMLAEFPQDFHEFTQVVCRDLWNALKHLSVPMEDVWIRVARGIELASTSAFHSLVLSDDVILIALIPTAGRVDAPVLESCLSSTSRNPSAFRSAASFLQKKFHRPSHYSIGLAHSHIFRGANVRASDLDFLGSLKYATLSRESDGYYSCGTVNHRKSSVPQSAVVKICIRMDEIRNWLMPPAKPAPPPARVQDESRMRTALPSPVRSTIAAPPEMPMPARTVYRPLTPTRNREAFSHHQSHGDDGANEDSRIFKPYGVAAESTPFSGARPGLEATIASDSAAVAFYNGGGVRGAPGNVSYLSSAAADSSDADTSVASMVHVTHRGNARRQDPIQDDFASTLQYAPQGVSASRSGQHYTIRPATSSAGASSSGQRPIAMGPLSPPPQMDASPAPSLGVSRIASFGPASSSTPTRGGGRTIVPTPSHFPASHSRWEERQARAPSLYN